MLLTEHGSQIQTAIPTSELLLMEDLRVGYLDRDEDIRGAVERIKAGDIVAAQMRGVFGIWANAEDQEAIDRILTIKGEPDPNKKFSSMMFATDFLTYVDISLTHQDIRHLFKDAGIFGKRFGAVCHVRAPVEKDKISEIPLPLVSQVDDINYMHNIDPFGRDGMNRFIGGLNIAGLKFIGVTSLNDHAIGEVEITDYQRAVEFCLEKRISSLLVNRANQADSEVSRPRGIGSFAIIDLKDLTAMRDGHIPVQIIERLIGVKLDNSNMQPHRHSQLDFTTFLEIDLDPEELRLKVISYVDEEEFT